MNRTIKLPKFYEWGGGCVPVSWSFGWLTGKDDDLICVLPSITTKENGELSLSPVCRNRLLAVLTFVCKLLILRCDENMSVKRSFYGNPNK